MDRIKIADIQVGTTYTTILVVKSATARETRAGKPYLALTFFDGNATINGNYWDWTSGAIPATNSIVQVSGQCTEWCGKKQLTVKSMALCTSVSLAEFTPKPKHDPAEAYTDAYALASDIKDDVLRDITLGLLDKYQDEWLTVPGARSIHHAYVGGTIVHSLSVARIAVGMAGAIPEANMDLCIAGALLHDLGKLSTYAMDGVNITYTTMGKLVDHIMLGSQDLLSYVNSTYNGYIGERATEVCDKVALLNHIILSHHGRLEFGSPVTPKCIEAQIVHHADMLDSIAEQTRVASDKLSEGIKWTDRLYGVGSEMLSPAYVSTVFEQEQ